MKSFQELTQRGIKGTNNLLTENVFLISPHNFFINKQDNKVIFRDNRGNQYSALVSYGQSEIKADIMFGQIPTTVKIFISLNQNLDFHSTDDQAAIQVYLKHSEYAVSQFWFKEGKLSRENNKPAVIHDFTKDESIKYVYHSLYSQEFYVNGIWCRAEQHLPVLETRTYNREWKIFNQQKSIVRIEATFKDKKSDIEKEIIHLKNGVLHNMEGPALERIGNTDSYYENDIYAIFGKEEIITSKARYRLDDKSHQKVKDIVENLQRSVTVGNTKSKEKLLKQANKGLKKFFPGKEVNLDIEIMNLVICEILDVFHDVVKNKQAIEVLLNTIPFLEEILEEELINTFVETEKGETIYLNRDILQSYSIDLSRFNTETLSEHEPQFMSSKEIIEKTEVLQQGIIVRLTEYAKLPLQMNVDTSGATIDFDETSDATQIYKPVFSQSQTSLDLRSFEDRILFFSHYPIKINRKAMTNYLIAQNIFDMESLREILNKVQEMYQESQQALEKIEELILLYKNHFREDIQDAKISLKHFLDSEIDSEKTEYLQSIEEQSQQIKASLWKSL